MNAEALQEIEFRRLSRKPAEAKYRYYLKRFFEGKTFPNGEPIPESVLFDPSHFKLMKWLHSEAALEVAREYLEENDYGYISAKRRSVRAIQFANRQADDARSILISEIMQDCFRCNIPKERSGGVLLIYLKLCMGYDVRVAA